MSDACGQLIDFAAARARHSSRVSDRGARNVEWSARRRAGWLAELRRERARLLRELGGWPSAFQRKLTDRVVRITEPDEGDWGFVGHGAAYGAGVFEARSPRSVDLAQLERRRSGEPLEGTIFETFEKALDRRLVDLRAAVTKLRAAEQRGDPCQRGRARAALSRTKTELLWTLFSFGRRECPRPTETRFRSSARDAGTGDSSVHTEAARRRR